MTTTELRQQVAQAAALPGFLATPEGERAYGRVNQFRRRMAEIPERIAELERELNALREIQADALLNDPVAAKRNRTRIAAATAELDENRETLIALGALTERESDNAEQVFRADGRARVLPLLLDIRANAVAHIHELLAEIGEANRLIDQVSSIAQQHEINLAGGLTYPGVNSLDVELWIGRVRRLGIPLSPRAVPVSTTANETAIQRRAEFGLSGQSAFADGVHKPELTGLRAQVRNIASAFESFVGRRRA